MSDVEGLPGLPPAAAQPACAACAPPPENYAGTIATDAARSGDDETKPLPALPASPNDSDDEEDIAEDQAGPVCALHVAAAAGDGDVVLKLLADSSARSMAEIHGALCKAAENGHVAVVRQLLTDARADPSGKRSESEHRPLERAARHGHLAVVRILVEEAKVVVEDGDSAVYAAATGNHIHVLEYLLRHSRLYGDRDGDGDAENILSETISQGNVAAAALVLWHARGLEFSYGDPLVQATRAGQLEILQLLLSDPRVVRSVLRASDSTGCRALDTAAGEGNIEAVKVLLSHPQINAPPYRAEAALAAAEKGRWDVARYFFQCAMPIEEKRAFLTGAAKRDLPQGVAEVLKDRKIRTMDCDIALEYACGFGSAAAVDVLLRDGRTDPTCDDHSAFIRAASCGHINVVERMLQHRRLRPSAQQNEALKQAAEGGYSDVVARLLQFDSVRVANDCQEALLRAAAEGQPEAMPLLLKVDGVDPCCGSHAASRCAGQSGDLELLKQLLADPRVDAAAAGHIALCAAMKEGWIDVVEHVLADPRISPAYRPDSGRACADEADPDAGSAAGSGTAGFHRKSRTPEPLMLSAKPPSLSRLDHPLAIACRKGVGQWCARLLADARVDPSACGNEAIAAAAGEGHTAIVKLLLADPRVDPQAALVPAAAKGCGSIVRRVLLEHFEGSAAVSAALLAAAEAGREKVVNLLLGDPRADPLSLATGLSGGAASAGTGTGSQGVHSFFDRLSRWKEAIRIRLRQQPCITRLALAHLASEQAEAAARAAGAGHGGAAAGLGAAAQPPARAEWSSTNVPSYFHGIRAAQMASLAWQRRKAAVAGWVGARMPWLAETEEAEAEAESATEAT